MNSTSLTLADKVRPQDQALQWVYYASLAVLGSAVLWISAKVQIPFYPVPLTLQTMVVLMIGAAFGWKLAAATVGLYLLEGVVGLPVFAGTPERGIGVAYMVGPTGGYLLGHLIAATFVGYFAERGFDRNALKLFAVMLVAGVLIYVPGLAWLSTFTGLEKAVAVGLVPFVYGDLLKTALAALTVPAAWALIGRG